MCHHPPQEPPPPPTKIFTKFHSVTNSEVQIEGYTAIRKDRNRNGGGVCSYIRDDLAFTPLPIQNTTEAR